MQVRSIFHFSFQLHGSPARYLAVCALSCPSLTSLLLITAFLRLPSHGLLVLTSLNADPRLFEGITYESHRNMYKYILGKKMELFNVP